MSNITESEPKTAKPTLGSVLLTAFHVLAVLAAFLICLPAYWMGLLLNTLFLLLLILAGAGAVSRVAGIYRKSLETRFVRRPFDRTFRKYLLQCINHWLFLIFALLILRVAIIPVQFSSVEYTTIEAIALGQLRLRFAQVHGTAALSTAAMRVVAGETDPYSAADLLVESL